VQHYLFEVLAFFKDDGSGRINYEHLNVIVFTLFIGAMVGIIEANGGTSALVGRVTHRVRTRRSGQLGAFLGGLVIFFDDYANAMILGPSMRPIFDRLRISRQKLAYIVDATAAADSSIFIGTWLAAEISYLQGGFDALGGHVPSFLQGMDATKAFWASIPYRSYAILALVMVFIIGLTGRDFGGMRKYEAEAAARKDPDRLATAASPAEAGRGWWLGTLPVLVLVGMTVGLLVYTGWQSCASRQIALDWSSAGATWESIKTILGKTDSYTALVYGSLCAVIVAVITTVAARALSLTKTMDAAVDGLCRIFAACLVLVLAWGLSQAGKDLHLGEAARDFLQAQVDQGVFSPQLLPLAIFVTACFVSFSTGTSWGTMGILCPAVIPIAAGVLSSGSVPAEQAMPLFYASVGAVLAGAVFGDHCSPISDTTVLSAIASSCDLPSHVSTQMPYAVVVASVCVLCMDGVRFAVGRWLPNIAPSYWHWSWAYGLVTGTILLFVIVLIFGRRPPAACEPVISIRTA
jgi:Na+/H+ antiporter NhaC